jgi:putative transposase
MARLTHRTQPGRTYFVTTKAWESRNLFQAGDVANIIVRRLLQCREEGHYLLHGFVVMPNHVHLLLTPGPRVTLEKAMQLIKGGSSHEVHRLHTGKFPLWQSGFHDWTIRNEGDFRSKQDYIRLNPVEAGLTERPGDWPFGSACGKFRIDIMPESLKASGAKAQMPEVAGNVGAKAPTP